MGGGLLSGRGLTRRELLRTAAVAAATLALPAALNGCRRDDVAAATDADDPVAAVPEGEDQERLIAWTAALRTEGLAGREVPIGRSATRVGELAAGTPYEAYTLEAYIRAGGSPSRTEPLTLSLTRFDCVSLVEACLAVARLADDERPPVWDGFGREMERMRYRGGQRGDYTSRLHYFSEWISDGAKRGLVQDLGAGLGGVEDRRPLRFMTENRDSYPALADDGVFRRIGEMERNLDDPPRWVIPTRRIADVSDRIESGDVIAFATAIPGLDVSHAAFAYRGGDDVLRVLHAPLSGGVVEVTRSTLPEYVAAIGRSTGVLVARPIRG